MAEEAVGLEMGFGGETDVVGDKAEGGGLILELAEEEVVGAEFLGEHFEVSDVAGAAEGVGVAAEGELRGFGVEGREDGVGEGVEPRVEGGSACFVVEDGDGAGGGGDAAAGPEGRWWGRGGEGADELVALTGKCLDEAGVGGGVVESGTYLGEDVGEAAFEIDVGIGAPDGFAEFLAGDDLVGLGEEEGEGAGGLGFEGDGKAVAEESLGNGIEGEEAEAEGHGYPASTTIDSTSSGSKSIERAAFSSVR